MFVIIIVISIIAIIRNFRNANEFQVSCLCSHGRRGKLLIFPRTYLLFLHLSLGVTSSRLFATPPPTLCRCSSLRNMLLVHITMVPNYCLSSGCPSQGPSFKLNLKRRKKNFHSMRQLLIQQINIEHLLCARHWSRCRGCCCE